MSETEALGGAEAEAEEGLSEVGEEAGTEASPEPEDPTPEYDFLDIEDPDAKYVRVTVDGEEQVVPFSEALRGYVGNATSTQRFQQASQMQEEARQALALQQAMSVNPAMTVQVLANQAGMTVEEFIGAGGNRQEEAPPEFSDPLERELWEERQARQALEQRFEQDAADRRLQAAIGGLRQQFGATDEDVNNVIMVAQQNGYGVEALPMVHQALQYQRLQAAAAARRDAQASQQKRDAGRQVAARQQSETISQGTGAVGTTPDRGTSGPMSFTEAFEAAWEAIPD